MQHQISITVESDDLRAVEALRDEVVELAEAGGTKVVSSAASAATALYTVIGVDTATGEKFSEAVEAESEAHAEEIVRSEAPDRVVVRSDHVGSGMEPETADQKEQSDDPVRPEGAPEQEAQAGEEAARVAGGDWPDAGGLAPG